jgi:hypothetical protein
MLSLATGVMAGLTGHAERVSIAYVKSIKLTFV